jgi:hypothetical protein
VHNGETELRIQLPSSHPLTAPVHPPKRVTGPPELHHSKGRYRRWRAVLSLPLVSIARHAKTTAMNLVAIIILVSW